eukprot:8914289-Pyramimonas_sp.AAC.1
MGAQRRLRCTSANAAPRAVARSFLRDRGGGRSSGQRWGVPGARCLGPWRARARGHIGLTWRLDYPT